MDLKEEDLLKRNVKGFTLKVNPFSFIMIEDLRI